MVAVHHFLQVEKAPEELKNTSSNRRGNNTKPILETYGFHSISSRLARKDNNSDNGIMKQSFDIVKTKCVVGWIAPMGPFRNDEL